MIDFSDSKKLRILNIEDSSNDSELLLIHIREAGYEIFSQRVETPEGMASALKDYEWDVILSDYALPHFSAPAAFNLLTHMGFDLPFIVVTGAIGEEKAVELMKIGVHDYILKDKLDRLVPAMERELREAKNRKSKRDIEEERNQLVADLRQAISSRDDFLSIASHELLTPLTSLKLKLQVMRKSLNHSIPSEILSKISPMIDKNERMVNRLINLVDELLDVSRIRTGRLLLMKEDTDLSLLVQRVLQGFQEQAKEANCELRVHLSPNIIGKIDSLRIEEVISNLISNSIKYASGKPIEVTTSTIGKNATIKIQDFGIGIAIPDQTRIFDRFERAVSMTHYGGLGLGLYITKQILDAHGGTISLESEVGKGSIFTIELPLEENIEQVAS